MAFFFLSFYLSRRSVSQDTLNKIYVRTVSLWGKCSCMFHCPSSQPGKIIVWLLSQILPLRHSGAPFMYQDQNIRLREIKSNQCGLQLACDINRTAEIFNGKSTKMLYSNNTSVKKKKKRIVSHLSSIGWKEIKLD